MWVRDRTPFRSELFHPQAWHGHWATVPMPLISLCLKRLWALLVSPGALPVHSRVAGPPGYLPTSLSLQEGGLSSDEPGCGLLRSRLDTQHLNQGPRRGSQLRGREKGPPPPCCAELAPDSGSVTKEREIWGRLPPACVSVPHLQNGDIISARGASKGGWEEGSWGVWIPLAGVNDKAMCHQSVSRESVEFGCNCSCGKQPGL